MAARAGGGVNRRQHPAHMLPEAAFRAVILGQHHDADGELHARKQERLYLLDNRFFT